MEKLSKILLSFKLEDAVLAEKNDRQFLAISRIFDKIWNSCYFFPLIITNSIVGYQLSSSWEEYREELAEVIENWKLKIENNYNFNFQLLYNFFSYFLPKSKGNKRLLNMKIPRIKKLESFFEKFIGNEKYYYSNLVELQNLLSKEMKQKGGDKTILFALKMFHYWARIVFKDFIVAPFEIWIPLDSRLAKLEKIYNENNLTREDFWLKISKEVKIPRLHLDAILWTKCNDFICLNK